jgi:hypothetical protein
MEQDDEFRQRYASSENVRRLAEDSAISISRLHQIFKHQRSQTLLSSLIHPQRFPCGSMPLIREDE